MARKWSVVRDELYVRHGGLYAVTPFDRLDADNKCVFKIGMAIDFDDRIDSYHTVFPLGVYICALLENPPLRHNGQFVNNVTKNSYYKIIEQHIFSEVIKAGGIRIHSAARVIKPNEFGEGSTEWFYCTEKVIKEAFASAYKKYGGENLFYPLKNLETKVRESEKKKPQYHGHIIYHFK